MFIYCFAGTVYDYYFQKDGQGQWNVWTDSIKNEENIIPAGAKVCKFCSQSAKVPLLTLACYLKHCFSLTGVRPYHPHYGDSTSAFFPGYLPGTWNTHVVCGAHRHWQIYHQQKLLGKAAKGEVHTKLHQLFCSHLSKSNPRYYHGQAGSKKERRVWTSCRKEVCRLCW